MNTTTTRIAALAAFATLSLAAAGSAFAQEATYDYPQASTSTVTRAQVQAELAAARADGSMKVWSTQYNPLTVAQSLKTRDEVRAERSAPTLAYAGEDSGSFALAAQQGHTQPARSLLALGKR